MDDQLKKKSRKRLRWNIIIFLCLIVFCGSTAGFGWTLWRSGRENSTFKELAKLAEAEAGSLQTEPEQEKDGSSEGEKGENAAQSEASRRRCQALAGLNEDFAAWLHIEGTKISYPVMHTPEDQQYYIHRDFYGKYSFSGTPFMGDRCGLDSRSIIIYAHNMNNGTMFGELDLYAGKEYRDAHPIIELDTPEGERRYEVAAAFRTRIFREGEEGFRYYEYVGDLTEEQFKEFADEVQKNALYDTGIRLSEEDDILILSTCSYHVEDGRFVVVAKRIEQ